MSSGFKNVGVNPTNSQLHEMYPDSSLSLAAQQYQSDYSLAKTATSQAAIPQPVATTNNPPTADPSTLKQGSAQANEVNSHTDAVIVTAVQSQSLDQQITALQLKVAAGKATDAEKEELANLMAQKDAVLATAPDPTDSSVISPDGSEVAATAAKQEFAANTSVTLPVPKVNNQGEVRYITIDQMDLVTYLNATQFMNPWGRNRQCDEDLKNLLKIINQDYNAELGEWNDVGERIAECHTD